MNGNPNWKGGTKRISNLIRDSKKNKSLIKWILERDNYTCQICKQYGCKLQVDHKKKFSLIFEEFIKKNILEKRKYILFQLALDYKDFWDENNLQVLCKSCNWKKELEYRKSKLSCPVLSIKK